MTETLIQSLLDPARYPHPARGVRLEETHISWVLLSGDYAYKIKKPVNFGFLDFSTLAKRRACCEAEIRLNRRYAPQLYLDVVPIGGTPAAPELPARGSAIEYAVRMRRFPDEARLDQRLAAGRLDADDIDRLAAVVAAMHAAAPHCDPAADFGRPAAVLAPMLANFTTLRDLPAAAPLHARLHDLEAWTRATAASLDTVLDARKHGGFVRECHGDLHLGNLAWVDDAPVPFDGIEFNEGLRWIDVMSDAAFLCMDLIDRGRADLGWRWLDAYLMHSGDYAGVAVLRFYQCYRALVRAKVAMLRGAQEQAASAAARDLDEASGYVDLATRFAQPPPACLLVMHGLSGSGKTYVSQRLLERIGALRVRSDVERKRLAGLAAAARSDSDVGSGLYTAARSEETYARLQSLADTLLGAGQQVIVDATNLSRARRAAWRSLAQQRRVPWLLINCEADETELRSRIRQRLAGDDDPSEAGLAVLDTQRRQQQALADDERADSIRIDTRTTDWLTHLLARVQSLVSRDNT